LEYAPVSGIPRKHVHSLQRLHSLALDFGTFAFAKDQASLPLDGLLRKTQHHALIIFLAKQTRLQFGTPTSLALSAFAEGNDYRVKCGPKI
jgi:hypothetical protein